ncbi:hypothetical protein F4776DRAFT_619525 [Hypoxylon sp. NC0597]|nr:hypothetical protein F4776DRAFT_619525 [Hypoxylon sp. NC0597]
MKLPISIPKSRYFRTAKHNSRYDRNDFEVIWQGREHFCPYWDDRPWPRQREDSTDPNNADIDSDLEESEDWDSDSNSKGGGAPIEQTS